MGAAGCARRSGRRGTEASAQGALDRLAGFDAGALSGGDRLDLITARAGLAVDAELARRFPFGRGFRPYRVTPFDGAWRGSDPAAIEADTRAIEKDAQAGVMLARPWRAHHRGHHGA
jgi:hypothetical protein